MNFLKIARIANEAEVKESQIFEYYRFLGANPRLDENAKDEVEKTIESLKKEQIQLESKLKKLVV